MATERPEPVPSNGDYWDIDAITAGLRSARSAWRSGQQRHAEFGPVGFPSRIELEKITAALCAALFPLRLGPNFVRLENEDAFVAETLDITLRKLYGQIRLELAYGDQDDGAAARIIGGFAAALPDLRILLDSDVEAAYAGDPAARSVDEILLCYPGMLAIIHHRLAHRLHVLGAPLVARIIAEIANSRTSIDIHPGAQIGARFFIDHGTGVVIGETTIIGERVRIYQAVTLGARTFPSAIDGSLEKGILRHPIVEDDVVIYAGATLLGRITIGRGSTIGGNVWLTESIPPGSVIHQARNERGVAPSA
ncbi:serine O-acetyltransferase EpsC [Sphingomonas immobilis]|uniref:serine O-acetyltransferase n=1 Tax=Sphingomonas immobilis TaxID=3063997 RepID=A0ABT9A241_9SPHN|nr:serine O-acetyltransferase EpsC [Sphingomonas sp. CA1-15]MDO7843899.1 serine O-acetyltransferase EpsC [Sphingomonas sp. CA1-15]